MSPPWGPVSSRIRDLRSQDTAISELSGRFSKQNIPRNGAASELVHVSCEVGHSVLKKGNMRMVVWTATKR